MNMAVIFESLIHEQMSPKLVILDRKIQDGPREPYTKYTAV
jgi:hypothetical protein